VAYLKFIKPLHVSEVFKRRDPVAQTIFELPMIGFTRGATISVLDPGLRRFADFTQQRLFKPDPYTQVNSVGLLLATHADAMWRRDAISEIRDRYPARYACSSHHPLM